jgi:hypothetical protein
MDAKMKRWMYIHAVLMCLAWVGLLPRECCSRLRGVLSCMAFFHGVLPGRRPLLLQISQGAPLRLIVPQSTFAMPCAELSTHSRVWLTSLTA